METRNVIGARLLRYGGAVIIAVFVVYGAASAVVSERLETYELNAREIIADQQATLVAIAEATARNGADAVTEAVVRDCTIKERSEFDELLGSLDRGLDQRQLATLERLFGRCGGFYSERKAVMVARLAREIEVYETYVSQLSSIVQEDLTIPFNVERWKDLAAEERRQSDLFARLVSLQDQIITTLLSGSTPSSPAMQSILQEAREVQETLMVASKQAAVIRAELVSL